MIFLSDTKWNGFKGQAHPITEDEIARAARDLGVKWSRLHGVMEVEAAFRRPGDGFDHEGRPKMLFEPHHFYKALQIRKPSMLSVAIARDLARPSRPPMSWYGNRSYWRLVQAIELDEVSGLLLGLRPGPRLELAHGRLPIRGGHGPSVHGRRGRALAGDVRLH
jgi:hypothetical protein